MIGHVNAFMSLIRHTLPELIKSFDLFAKLYSRQRNRRQ